MQQWETTFYNFINAISPYYWIAVAIAVIVLGVMFLGGEKAREKAKGGTPWVLFGALLIKGGIEFGQWIMGNIAF